MFRGEKVLAIITARGGSKRLPGKNIKELNGKPLIGWTIEAALGSIFIDKVIVSTDNEQIANISKQSGATIPFLRPSKLSTDYSTSFDVIVHALNHFDNLKEKYNYFILLQPTSPLRTKKDIDLAFKSFLKNTKAVISVCPVEHLPLWSNTLPDNLSMNNFIKPEIKNKRMQDFPVYYRINGAIYISEVNYFNENKGFFGAFTSAFIMSPEKSIDIDTHLDFEICKILMNENNKNYSKA